MVVYSIFKINFVLIKDKDYLNRVAILAGNQNTRS